MPVENGASELHRSEVYLTNVSRGDLYSKKNKQFMHQLQLGAAEL